MSLSQSLYYYTAHVTGVYDGDSITVDIDLGLKTWVKGEKLRLYRINAPEMRGAEKPQGTLSRDFLREQILDKTIYVQTIRDKKGKYGRYIAELWLEKDEQLVNINDLLVSSGHAVYKDY